MTKPKPTPCACTTGPQARPCLLHYDELPLFSKNEVRAALGIVWPTRRST
jgi:hypothetical protein